MMRRCVYELLLLFLLFLLLFLLLLLSTSHHNRLTMQSGNTSTNKNRKRSGGHATGSCLGRQCGSTAITQCRRDAEVLPAFKASDRLQKRIAPAAQFLFQLLRAITIATRPRLRSIFVPAVSARVRVLNAQEFEIFLPIRPFFRERWIAKADLDPSRNSVFVDARLLHIMEVFVTGDRTASEGALINRAKERACLARF